MKPHKHEITAADILPIATYARERKTLRLDMVALKRRRRVEVGPYCTFYFENYQTMWHQVHEMLFIEKGGEAQIADELRAYNPLIPKGDELVATVMFEIENAERRAAILLRLGGVERHMLITVAGETIRGEAEGDVERTRADGKASSVHFVRFRFTRTQIASFLAPDVPVMVGIDHQEYKHMAGLPADVRSALSEDFDQPSSD